jgi:hypothetical protein
MKSMVNSQIFARMRVMQRSHKHDLKANFLQCECCQVRHYLLVSGGALDQQDGCFGFCLDGFSHYKHGPDGPDGKE